MRRTGTTTIRPGRVPGDVRVDAVQHSNVFWREHVVRGAGRQDLAVLEEDQRPAEAGCEVEIVRRDGDGDRDVPLQFAKQLAELELIGEIECDGWLVEQQDPVALGGRRSARARRPRSRAASRRR